MPYISPAHWHVLVNHLPIIGMPFAMVLLAWGLFLKQEQVVRVALLAIVLVAISAWVTDTLGDGAKHQIRDLPWANREVIQAHEDAGDKANIVSLVTGAAALVTLVLARKGKPVRRGFASGVLVLTLVSTGFLSYAGWQGGKIRHVEFGNTPTAQPPTTP
ncbi:MAG: hypothetical protein ACREL5_07330 [Gemmatimonadales bacterium]